jgi:hypothetical protein
MHATFLLHEQLIGFIPDLPKVHKSLLPQQVYGYVLNEL